jgi:cell division protein ZapE
MHYFQPECPAGRFQNNAKNKGHGKGKSPAHKKLSTENPLVNIARSWANKVQVLCFDEFFVSDIGDAILLAGLFDEMFKQGMVLIATSNCKPEQLYQNGLQRERFLPTIELINRHCQVISVNGDKDHRLSGALSAHHSDNPCLTTVTQLERNYPAYAFPLHAHEDFIKQQFDQLTEKALWQSGSITINHRTIHYLAQSTSSQSLNPQSISPQPHVIVFDFYALCSAPRSQRDYMALAKQFSHVLIQGVPQFSGELMPAVFSGVEERYQRSGIVMKDLRQLDDEARRFIALIDEFYDQKIAVIISAEVDIIDLYQGQQLAFEFERCKSRLFEMQSV